MGSRRSFTSGMLSRAGTALLAIACLGGTACDGSGVARIEVGLRDVVLYGRGPMALPVRVIDRAGVDVSPLEVTVHVSSDSAVSVRVPYEVVCQRVGAADVDVQAGGLTERIHVRCRNDAVLRVVPFAERVAGDSPRQLKFAVDVAVGDAPRALMFEAAFRSGEREIVRPRRVEVMDAQVAYLRGDSIVAVAPGRRLFAVDLGGQWLYVVVSVSAALANDTLALAAGQFRSWTLNAGRYTLTVAALAGPNDLRRLDMVTDGARCVRNLRSEDTIHCVVYERGTVIVRNLGADPGSPARRAYVRIVRTP